MYKKIIIYYWIQSQWIQEKMKFIDGEIFDYSIKTRNEIIDRILENDLQVMIKKADNNIYILIDNGNFRQR